MTQAQTETHSGAVGVLTKTIRNASGVNTIGGIGAEGKGELIADVPNTETLEAIAESEAILKGGYAKRYNSAQEMFDDIFAGEDWRL